MPGEGGHCATAVKPIISREAHHRLVTATDTFTEFVTHLADALDDPDIRAHERVHLSRFHFDRLIRGVAGEPPMAFRRRILLERAAYRMLTTKDSLLDIALDAGYGSHEAFTRAFTRTYGITPARWRRQPTQFRISAPSNVHFNPPGGLRLPARPERMVTDMELLTSMVEHHVWLTGELVRTAARLDDQALDQPIVLSVDEEQQTIRSLLSRLVGQMGMWNAVLADRPYDWSVEEHESLDSMRSRIGREGPAFLANVHEVIDGDRLDETFVDALCEPAEVFTYGGMIAHVLTTAAHRRALVLLALDTHGRPELGWGDPMHWVAEPRPS